MLGECRVGDQYQAILPVLGLEESADRSDTLVWDSSTLTEDATSYLSRARSLLQPLKFAWEEAALAALQGHAGDVDAALRSLETIGQRAAENVWSQDEKEELRANLKRTADLRLLYRWTCASETTRFCTFDELLSEAYRTPLPEDDWSRRSKPPPAPAPAPAPAAEAAKSAPASSSPRAPAPAPAPAAVPEPTLFEVESILARRPIGKGKKRGFEYLIKWQGFDSSHDSWQPRENLLFCKKLLSRFDAKAAASASSSGESATGKRPAPVSSEQSAKRQLSKQPIEVEELDELNDQERGCGCASSCSLLPLLQAGLVSPGANVLSMCCKGDLIFADLTDEATIALPSCKGTPLTLRTPCALVRILRRRHGYATLHANPLKMVHYKGLPLEGLFFKPSAARSRRGE